MNALRRHHRDRMRERNRRNYPTWPDAWKFGDTRCKCSNPQCCGNPRRYAKGRERMRIQELKQIEGR